MLANLLQSERKKVALRSFYEFVSVYTGSCAQIWRKATSVPKTIGSSLEIALIGS
jgi:hypothetical protein